MSFLHTIKNKTLKERLQQASVCCNDCGAQYGIHSVGCSSIWMGICHVCGEEKPVTETRDYGYLYKGLRKILKEEQETKVLAVSSEGDND